MHHVLAAPLSPHSCPASSHCRDLSRLVGSGTCRCPRQRCPRPAWWGWWKAWQLPLQAAGMEGLEGATSSSCPLPPTFTLTHLKSFMVWGTVPEKTPNEYKNSNHAKLLTPHSQAEKDQTFSEINYFLASSLVSLLI